MKASVYAHRLLARAERRGAGSIRISIPRLRELLADVEATQQALDAHRSAVETAVKALRRADRAAADLKGAQKPS
jgi:hypothetical protein